MVFEFDGAPPALLNDYSKPPPFASFGPTTPATPGSPQTTGMLPTTSPGGYDSPQPICAYFPLATPSTGSDFGMSVTPWPMYDAPPRIRRARNHDLPGANGETTNPLDDTEPLFQLDPPPEPELSIRIDHPRLWPVQKELKDHLRDYEIVSHEVGIHILAGIIMEYLCKGANSGQICSELFTILGLDGADTTICSNVCATVGSACWSFRKANAAFKKDVDRLGPTMESALLAYNHNYVHAPAFITAPATCCMIDPPPRLKLPTPEMSTSETAPAKIHEAATEVVAPFTPFRFLDLAPELRNFVYNELLAPGQIWFGSFRARYFLYPGPYKSSTIQSGILATCRQINSEAKDILYAGNTVCVSAYPDCDLAIIRPAQVLPNSVLPRLTSLMLVVDCTMIGNDDLVEDFFSKIVDWKQLQHMTGLKNIRICMLENEAGMYCWDVDFTRMEMQTQAILGQIIDRIPAACEVAFESREGLEDDYVQMVMWDNAQWSGEEPIELDREVLEPAFTKEIKAGQGCKSGRLRDFRYSDRSIGSSLVDLGRGSEFVLGR